MKCVDESVLRKKYIDEQKSIKTISKELGVSAGCVFNHMKKYGIEARDQKSTFNFRGKKHSEDVLEIISKTHKGKVLSDETKRKMSASKKVGGIGHKKKRSDGYIYVYFPDHPKSSKDGYIMEHILVIEALHGRHLNEDECVHHINHVRHDNRKENLKLMTKHDHMSMHSKERFKKVTSSTK